MDKNYTYIDKNTFFECPYDLFTCHQERMDFYNCMKEKINNTLTTTQKEEKCKQLFYKYTKCVENSVK
tara:strand:- start:259 stop:462 length:204 start_codon:yes stop_codon:yes gene_type:complete